MAVRDKRVKLPFPTVDRGRPGQIYYPHQKDKTPKAEKWLDGICNRILIEYEADYCKEKLGGSSF